MDYLRMVRRKVLKPPNQNRGLNEMQFGQGSALFSLRPLAFCIFRNDSDLTS